MKTNRPMNNLNRFIHAQESDWDGYETALEEMRRGEKRSHWIWYVFPQMKGLGRSYNSDYYGIASLFEARQYIEDEVLGKRIKEITHVVLSHDRSSIEDIMGGHTDAMKFRSSMTLFDIVCPGEVFERVLNVFFEGKRDEMTLGLVGDEMDFYRSDSPLARHGLSRYPERGFFEYGVVESQEIPREGKLPTFVDLYLKGERMEAMVRHYLYWKDFSAYRLDGVESCLSGYCHKLVNRVLELTTDLDKGVLTSLKQWMDSIEDAMSAAEAFDGMMAALSSDPAAKEALERIAGESLIAVPDR